MAKKGILLSIKNRLPLFNENRYQMYGYTIQQYVERQATKNKAKLQKHIAKLKEKGLEYYTPARLDKIRFSFDF